MPTSFKTKLYFTMFILTVGFLFTPTADAITSSSDSSQSNDIFDLDSLVSADLTPDLIASTSKINGADFTVFETDKNPKLQTMIDDAFTLIYSTRAAQVSLISMMPWNAQGRILNMSNSLLFSGSDPNDLEFTLGVPWALSNKILLASGAASQTHSRITAQYTCAGTHCGNMHQKVYLFARPISNTDVPMPFDSYTTKDNLTIIFVDPYHTTKFDLLRILAHEISISGDQKSDLATFMVNFDPYTPAPKIMDGVLINSYLEVFRSLVFEQEVLRQVIGEKALLERSSTIERQIYKMNRSDENSCRKSVDSYAALLAQNKIYNSELPEALKQLWSLGPTILIAGKKIPTCQMVTDPLIRGRNHFTEGPRPRISDWDSSRTGGPNASPNSGPKVGPSNITRGTGQGTNAKKKEQGHLLIDMIKRRQDVSAMINVGNTQHVINALSNVNQYQNVGGYQ